MRRLVLGSVVLGLVIGMASTTWTRGIEPQGGKGVFAGLKVGQPVMLKDVGVVYEVRVLDEPIPTVEAVAEIGIDYLGVKNEAGIETRIPVTSIKAIIRVPTR
jgi:hypothetical protein